VVVLPRFVDCTTCTKTSSCCSSNFCHRFCMDVKYGSRIGGVEV
jgi:hypothetical protein